MSCDVDLILDLIDSDRINREVLQEHDWARERFQVPAMAARDHREYQEMVEAYVQHHLEFVGQGRVSAARAFGGGSCRSTGDG